MATATKKSSSSKNSSSTRAKSNDTLAKKMAADIHAKRESYDNPPVDTPVPLDQAVGQAVGVDDKKTLDFVVEGPTVTVSIGSQSVVLDREGILSAQRHLNQAAANV